MTTQVFRSEEDWWNDEKPTGEAVYEDVWMNDELDSVGVVDLFCDESLDEVPAGGLTIETDMEFSVGFPSPGKLVYPSLLDLSAPTVTPRTFNSLCSGLDLDRIFDDDYTHTENGHRQFTSRYGQSLAINSNIHSGINLGELITNTTYNLIKYSPFSSSFTPKKTFFGDDY